ncbi:MAG: tryptophan-rich sensory protein, partial [Opitutales bacterium]|nr:tryptophan-rich sensory protein [Opitutales bacterium]
LEFVPLKKWRKTMKDKINAYVVSILIAMGVGALAAYFTSAGMRTLYAEIQTPPLAPPAVIFPIVWTALYFLMGLSAAMIWAEKSPEKAAIRRRALIIYAASLAVNFSWCFVFFSFRAFGVSFVWLLVLLTLVLKTICEYRKISPRAAYWQIPYAVWLCFAGYLTCGIWFLN